MYGHSNQAASSADGKGTVKLADLDVRALARKKLVYTFVIANIYIVLVKY